MHGAKVKNKKYITIFFHFSIILSLQSSFLFCPLLISLFPTSLIVYNVSLRAEEEMQSKKHVRTATASVSCVRLLGNGAEYGSLMFKMYPI
jgi:hypothetical protein